MDKYTLAIRCRLVDEVKYLVCHFVLGVKEHLILLVNPIEGKISDTNRLPHVSHCIAGAINYVSHFIRSDEFQILTDNMIKCLKSNSYKHLKKKAWRLENKKTTYLSCEFITNKKAILDLDCTHEIILTVCAEKVFRLGDAHTTR